MVGKVSLQIEKPKNAKHRRYEAGGLNYDSRVLWAF
jgi:hypothetical protein